MPQRVSAILDAKKSISDPVNFNIFTLIYIFKIFLNI